jgi:hypothetical protein
MSALAPTVQAFFTQRLIHERNASPHTIAAYRDTIRLLLRYTAQRCEREPSMLDVADLDADTVAAFSITSKLSVATALERGTRGWRRSIRSTDTPRCAIPSTRRTSNACSRSHPNAPTARWSRSSNTTRSTGCSLRPIARPGPAAATTRC